MKSTINEARFIPSSYTQFIIIPEMGLEVYHSIQNKMAIGFVGKAKNQSFHYRYTSEERMFESINGWVEKQKEFADRKEKEKAEKKRLNDEINAKDHFKVGDFIVNTWGYEQTNVDFYIVTDVKDKTIEIKEVYGSTVKDSMYSHGMACEVVPTTKLIENGKSYKLRVKSGYQGSVALSNPKSFYYMHKWSGRPEYNSWYA